MKCQQKCPKPTECKDCIGLPKHCAKQTDAVCKGLGFKKGRCKAPLPDCTIPKKCDECISKPKTTDKKCKKKIAKKCKELKKTCDSGEKLGGDEGFFIRN